LIVSIHRVSALLTTLKSKLPITPIDGIDWSGVGVGNIVGGGRSENKRRFFSRMAMMNFYFHATPNSMKVAVLLHELDLPFDVIPIDISKGKQHSPEFRAVNPNGKVPALIDGEVKVFDSHAILLYLAEKHGQFIPTDPVKKAAMLSWLQLVATGLSPFSGQAIHFHHYAPEDLPYAKTRYLNEVIRTYKVLDERLTASDWLAGDEYTVADMALWGWAASAGYIFGEAGLNGFPAVERFMEKMSERSAVQQAIALKASHTFKTELDDETRKALFPQNVK
jgi:GST-like protein